MKQVFAAVGQVVMRARLILLSCLLSIGLAHSAFAKDGEEIATCLVMADELGRLNTKTDQPRNDALFGIAFLSAAYEAGGLNIPDEIGARIMGIVNAKAMQFDAMAVDAKRTVLEPGLETCRPLLQRVKADLEALQQQLMAMLTGQNKTVATLPPGLEAQSQWVQERLNAGGAHTGDGRSRLASVATNLTVNSSGTHTEIVIKVQQIVDTLTDDELIARYCPTPQAAIAYCKIAAPIAPIRVKLAKKADGTDQDGRLLHCLVPDRATAAQVTGAAPPLSCDSFF